MRKSGACTGLYGMPRAQGKLRLLPLAAYTPSMAIMRRSGACTGSTDRKMLLRFLHFRRPWRSVDKCSRLYRHFRRPWRSVDKCSRPYQHFRRPWRSVDKCSRLYRHFRRPWRSVDKCSRPYRHFRRPWRSVDKCSRPYRHFRRPWRSYAAGAGTASAPASRWIHTIHGDNAQERRY